LEKKKKDKDVVKWFWAGDGAGGHQDIWVEYDALEAAKFEDAYNRKLPEIKVDSQRFF